MMMISSPFWFFMRAPQKCGAILVCYRARYREGTTLFKLLSMAPQSVVPSSSFYVLFFWWRHQLLLLCPNNNAENWLDGIFVIYILWSLLIQILKSIRAVGNFNLFFIFYDVITCCWWKHSYNNKTFIYNSVWSMRLTIGSTRTYAINNWKHSYNNKASVRAKFLHDDVISDQR